MQDRTIKEELIFRIVNAEWKMFINVQNAGGKAACQEDYNTFKISRSSQFMSWSEAALKSHMEDLIEAELKDRNLLTEKYARMMKSTSPLEYAEIEHLFPALDADTNILIEKIIEIVMEWEQALFKQYPHILKTGRLLHSSEDTQTSTSVETYLRGELATYSSKTLGLYYENALQQKSENINGAEIVMLDTVKSYGFQSLEEANKKLMHNTEA